MAGKECAYYSVFANEYGKTFTSVYRPCEPSREAVASFVEELNNQLAISPDAISAHLKALQKATGCLALFINAEQTPDSVKVLIGIIRAQGKCSAIPLLPENGNS